MEALKKIRSESGMKKGFICTCNVPFISLFFNPEVNTPNVKIGESSR